MRIQYRLYEKDYLQHQLYLASISKSIENKRKRNYFWLILVFAGTSIIAYLSENNELAILSLIIAIITTLFYPSYERKQFEKYYKDFIKENYPDKHDENSYTEFMDKEVLIHNEHSETKLDYSEIDRIIEITNYIFIRIGATSLIIPMDRIENMNEVRFYLKTLSKNMSIEYIENFEWQWK